MKTGEKALVIVEGGCNDNLSEGSNRRGRGEEGKTSDIV